MIVFKDRLPHVMLSLVVALGIVALSECALPEPAGASPLTVAWTAPPDIVCEQDVNADERVEQHLDWDANAEVDQVLTGAVLVKWTAAYNLRPPKSSFVLDKVTALKSSVYGGRYFLVLSGDGCVAAEGPMDIDVFDDLKNGAGQDA